MRIRIATKVGASVSLVKEGFTQDLFLRLNPPVPPVRLLQFDGCSTGDQVVLQLNFFLFRQQWVSDIISDHQDASRWYFVDEGAKLPFFLKKWKHHHEVKKRGDAATIIDAIQYTSGTLLTDVLLYPLLLGQFLYRKPIYKIVFSGRR